MSTRDAVIISAVRTPTGKFLGALKDLSAAELGARVVLTRKVNSEKRWGPCVDRRGRAGNKIPADLKISIHADGSYARGAHGFHVIMPADRRPWTHDIWRSSRRLALVTRAALVERGLAPATYVAGGEGLDERRDLGTLNLAAVPAGADIALTWDATATSAIVSDSGPPSS